MLEVKIAKHPPFIKVVGTKYGRLTLIRHLGGKHWLCVCDCGVERIVQSGNLAKGFTKSCGCLTKDRMRNSNPSRGNRVSIRRVDIPEYICWKSILNRCTCQKHRSYAYYGGRGMTVCERWLGKDGFDNFFADMGTKPTPKHSLDRIDNDKGYDPTNCRWATHSEQMKNRRPWKKRKK